MRTALRGELGQRLTFVKPGVALGDGNKLEGVANDDWTPLGFSSAGAFAGPIAFVGYGIDATPIGYNDFDGVDPKRFPKVNEHRQRMSERPSVRTAIAQELGQKA